MSKRRRSPRTSPRRTKRQKLERTPTVELEEPEDTIQSPLDRKTSSFLEQKEESGSFASLSADKKAKLLRRLSSVLCPDAEEKEPEEDITIEEPLGIGKEIEFANDDVQPLARIPVDAWIGVCAYLSDRQRWALAATCKRMVYIIDSIVGFSHQLLAVDSSSFNVARKNFLADEVPDKAIVNVNSLTRKHTWLMPTGPLFAEASLLREHLKKSIIPSHTSQAFRAHFLALCRSYWQDLKWLEPNHGILSASPACQPEGLKLQLYEYQASNLSWMLRVEGIVRAGQKFSFSTLTRLPCSLPLVMDSFESAIAPIMPVDADNKDDYQNWFTIQGGMFADEMGLGKTISLVSLILSNPRPTDRKGNLIRNSSIPSATKIYFSSRATLVICPSQLVSQWTKEITTHSNLTVCNAATSAQHRKLSYQMVVESDVVVISEKFLFGNQAYKALVDVKMGKTMYSSRDVKEEVELSHRNPVFQLIDWHRIIIDEAHEILANHDVDDYFSSYRWYVTGTPLPKGGESLDNALGFLRFRSKKYADGPCANITSANVLHRTIYRRNTKASVDTQITIPPVVEKIEFVSLTPIEQVLYDAATFDNNDNELRRIISDPTCGNSRRLDDPYLLQNNINTCKAQLRHQSSELSRLEGELRRETAKLDKSDDPDGEKALKRTITFLERRKASAEDEIVRLIGKSACFSRLLIGDDVTDLCDSCGGLTPARTELAECNHHLCPECIALASQESKCPKCDKAFNITKVKTAPTPALPDGKLSFLETDDDDPWFSSLRLRYGSKFAATSRYLLETMRADTEVKMIVFSQYEGALQKIERVLEDVDPDTFANRMIVCKGNVHARKRQLEGFNSTDPDSARILLLSLKNAASGTHLPAATHVLLLDPVVGDAGVAQATDAQAVARAHRLGQDKPVVAVRFIIPRTVDQKDYEKAYGLLMRPGLGPKSARSARPPS